MNAQPSPKYELTPESWPTRVLGINPSSPFFAAGLLIILLLLSACVGHPPRPVCEYPRPNADLMAELPEPGYFRTTLECILDPTSDPNCERLLIELTR